MKVKGLQYWQSQDVNSARSNLKEAGFRTCLEKDKLLTKQGHLLTTATGLEWDFQSLKLPLSFQALRFFWRDSLLFMLLL